MSSSFWIKGFYFERRVFFYSSFKLQNLFNLKGISFFFCLNFFSRLPFFDSLSHKIYTDNHNICGLLKQKTALNLNVFNQLITRIVFINLLLTTFPVFLEYSSQQKSNIWKHFLMRSKRGIFLRISKPLGRRTRARTFFKKHQTKRLVSEKLSRTKRATANWF